MKLPPVFALIFFSIAPFLTAKDVEEKTTVHLSVRASEINPEAKEHPEIGFVFTNEKGKPADEQHAVYNPKSESRGQLVIWLMGYNAGLFERLADYGYHAIQPHYANRWFSLIDAAARDSGEALGDVRLEAATGEDYSQHVEIPNPDGMMARAYQFVKWLDKEDPKGKWGQFLSKDSSGLDWDKVIMSGSSHGSTTSARFAKHQKVARVVMLCGPRDQYETWQGLPSATPANRYFGFSHILDSGWTGDHYCRSWQLLGLGEFGHIVDVDTSEPPFGNSRRLVTDFDVKGDAKRAHSSVQPGGSAAKDEDGNYLHEAVWRYLFTHPVDETGSPVEPDADCQMDLR